MDEFVAAIYEILPEGWDTDADTYGAFDCTFTAPDGCQIEADGNCAHGYVSPLRQAGLI